MPTSGWWGLPWESQNVALGVVCHLLSWAVLACPMSMSLVAALLKAARLWISTPKSVSLGPFNEDIRLPLWLTYSRIPHWRLLGLTHGKCQLHIAQGSGNGGFQTVVRVLSGDQTFLPPLTTNWTLVTSMLPLFNLLNLQFPNALVLNAVGRRNTQMRAKERKWAQKGANASPQKSAKGRKGRFRIKNCEQPGLKQPGLGTPNWNFCFVGNLEPRSANHSLETLDLRAH